MCEPRVVIKDNARGIAYPGRNLSDGDTVGKAFSDEAMAAVIKLSVGNGEAEKYRPPCSVGEVVRIEVKALR